MNTAQTEFELANPGRRWLAAMIDYTFYFLFIMVMLYAFGAKKIDSETGNASMQLTGLPALLLLSSWFLYLPLLESLTGQSIGKGILGLKVMKQNYSKAGYSDCVVRHLLDIADGILAGMLGVIVASNNPIKQRIGDIVAKTIVVRVP